MDQGDRKVAHRRIDEPSKLDIVSGRGKGIEARPSSKLFRALMMDHTTHYKTALRGEKRMLVRQLASHLEKQGMRFVKYDEALHAWTLMPDLEIQNKIAHALRDVKTRKQRDSTRKSKKAKRTKSASASKQVTPGVATTSSGAENKLAELANENKATSTAVGEEYSQTASKNVNASSTRGREKAVLVTKDEDNLDELLKKLVRNDRTFISVYPGHQEGDNPDYKLPDVLSQSHKPKRRPSVTLYEALLSVDDEEVNLDVEALAFASSINNKHHRPTETSSTIMPNNPDAHSFVWKDARPEGPPPLSQDWVLSLISVPQLDCECSDLGQYSLPRVPSCITAWPI